MERDGARRVLEIMEGALVELVVVLLLHVGGALLPDGSHGVDGLELLIILPLGRIVVASVLGLGLLAMLGNHHLDGVAHVVAVLLDQVLEAPLGQVGIKALAVFAALVLADRQNNIGTVGGALGGLDGVALKAVALPHVGFVRTKSAAHNAHTARYHEGRVKAHAKLADDIHIVALTFGVLGLELLAAGMGNGTQVLLQLLGSHANAVIRNGKRTIVLVKGDADGKIGTVDVYVIIRKALEVELVHSVGSVGDKLAQEDLFIGIDGVNHQIEQLFALCLELAHIRILSL